MVSTFLEDFVSFLKSELAKCIYIISQVPSLKIKKNVYFWLPPFEDFLGIYFSMISSLASIIPYETEKKINKKRN